MQPTRSLLVAALGVALALPLAAAAQPKGDPAVREAKQAYHAASLLQALELTDAQRAELKQKVKAARDLKDRLHDDKAATQARKRYVDALKKATAELRKSGAVSEATRTALTQRQSELDGLRASHHTLIRNALQEAWGVLTDAQHQQVAEQMRAFRGEMGHRMGPGMPHGGRGGRGGRGGMGPGMGPGAGGDRPGPGAGQPGLRLLMSDAFWAELSR